LGSQINRKIQYKKKLDWECKQEIEVSLQTKNYWKIRALTLPVNYRYINLSYNLL
jgi:hypothetical protein